MSHTMNVTVCQMRIDPAGMEEDFDALINHVQQNRSDFVLLPEMPFYKWLAATSNENAKDWSLAIENHEKWIGRLAELNVEAVLSSRPIINQAGSRRNQAYIWRKETGAVGFHDKRFLPNEEGYWEATWYDMGEDRFDTARVGDARIGVQICTEMWFFEKSRQYGQQAVDLLCCPRATPHSSVGKWLAGGQAGAVVSGAYHLSSNGYMPVGAEADMGGLSWVVSPEGDVLAKTDPDNPFATVEVDLAFSKLSKTTYPRDVKV